MSGKKRDWEEWHRRGPPWANRDPEVWRRWQERRRWRGRWGLRRRLTFAFAFVALAAVFITTWFTLGAVSSVLFPGQPDGFVQNPGDGPWSWRDNPAWNSPQFAQAREAFGRITGTAFWAGTLAFLLAVIAAAIFTRILTRPLIALTDGARRLEAGERGIQLRVPRSRDELRALTEAFNNLVRGLERQEAWRRGLVADIAHDLRTPLAVLRSEIEAMQDGVATPDPAGLDRLHGQVMLLSRLVDDLRTLSLAESGGLSLKKEEVRLEPFLRGVVEAFAARANGDGTGLELCPVTADLEATFDPGQVTRVLNNLLDNAMRHGAGPIQVSAAAEPEGIKITVRDHGPGIPPEALERVFERFYKTDASRTRREGEAGGSGLGLSIARAIVEAHGGRLEASNHLEGGAVFTVFLPG